jgi:hypothetical protein
LRYGSPTGNKGCPCGLGLDELAVQSRSRRNVTGRLRAIRTLDNPECRESRYHWRQHVGFGRRSRSFRHDLEILGRRLRTSTFCVKGVMSVRLVYPISMRKHIPSNPADKLEHGEARVDEVALILEQSKSSSGASTSERIVDGGGVDGLGGNTGVS